MIVEKFAVTLSGLRNAGPGLKALKKQLKAFL